jgi:FecR-like protein
MKKIHILMFLTLFIWCVPQIHADSAGFLNLEKGIVKISRSGIILIYKKAGLKIPIYNLDQIHTGKNTFATVKLTSKDDIELYPRSVLKISMDDIRMPLGKALFKIKKRKKTRKRLMIRTTNAIIGIKGTEFIVDTSEGLTNLFTLTGIVTMANINLPDVVVEIIDNYMSQVKKDLAPTEPIYVAPDLRNKIIAGETAKAFPDVLFGKTIGKIMSGDKNEELNNQDDNIWIEDIIENIEDINETQRNEDIEEKFIEIKINH